MFSRIRILVLIVVLLASFAVGMMPTEHAEAAQTCTLTHVVQPGENLFRIGLRYGVQWPTLQAWNYLPNANSIYVGQILCVNGYASGGTPTPPTPTPVVIYPGNPFGPTTQPRAYFPQATLGQSFQLYGYNFPANRQVTISITTLGNPPYIPYYTATTLADGTFFVEVQIPDGLQNASTIAVDVRTSNGYYARNWFYNY